MCVQRFDDSLNSAIHITYRISLRSSSMPEPRDPLLKVLTIVFLSDRKISGFAPGTRPGGFLRRPGPPRQRVGNQGWRFGPGDPRSVMILPQVHLRKPCYDFYFL